MIRTTICIKSFNRPLLTKEAIESCLNQTRMCAVLIVDDGSDNQTLRILDSYASDNPNVKLVRLGHNQGPSNANNVAIALASTVYLGFLDSDDTLNPNFVRELEDTLGRTLWADFAYCRFAGGPKWTLNGSRIFRQVLAQGHLSALGTFFGRTEAFRRLPKLPTRKEIGVAADACDDDRLSFEASRKAGIIHLPKELYNYRGVAVDRLTKNSALMLHAWTRFFSDYRNDYKNERKIWSYGRNLARVYSAFAPEKMLRREYFSLYPLQLGSSIADSFALLSFQTILTTTRLRRKFPRHTASRTLLFFRMALKR